MAGGGHDGDVSLGRLVQHALPGETAAHYYVRLGAALGVFLNAYLLVLNLLPVFPMDGGRILQAVLWFGMGYARSWVVAGVVGMAGGIGLWLLRIGIEADRSSDSVFGFQNSIGFRARRGQPDIFLIIVGFLGVTSSFRVFKAAMKILATQRANKTIGGDSVEENSQWIVGKGRQ